MLYIPGESIVIDMMFEGENLIVCTEHEISTCNLAEGCITNKCVLNSAHGDRIVLIGNEIFRFGASGVVSLDRHTLSPQVLIEFNSNEDICERLGGISACPNNQFVAFWRTAPYVSYSEVGVVNFKDRKNVSNEAVDGEVLHVRWGQDEGVGPSGYYTYSWDEELGGSRLSYVAVSGEDIVLAEFTDGDMPGIPMLDIHARFAVLGSRCWGASLRILNLLNGESVSLLPSFNGYTDTAIVNNGRFLVCTRPYGEGSCASAFGFDGEPKWETCIPGTSSRCFISPDGLRVLAVSADKLACHVLNAETGATECVISNCRSQIVRFSSDSTRVGFGHADVVVANLTLP